MYKKVISGAVYGITGRMITVEADISCGFPSLTMVGYLASEVREARERVMTAVRNSGFQIPAKRIVVNLSPADIRKQGTAFDLPIAAAVMAAMGNIRSRYMSETMIVGELGLQGNVMPVRGILPLALLAKESGLTRMIVPEMNAAEAGLVSGLAVTGVGSLAEAAAVLNDRNMAVKMMQEKETAAYMTDCVRKSKESPDFSELFGQEVLKRGIEIAAAGGHHLLMVGPPGVGKSLAARCIPSVLPQMSFEECLEVTKIHSVAGQMSGDGLMTKRPFRAPHHSASVQALIGGGRIPMPGEISLAHRGVLFLDELPEFGRRTLETLRQPLEEGEVMISRVYGNYIFPARMMLVAAMNPCPCGFYPDRNRCYCTSRQVEEYIGHISRPILDRFDMTIEAAPVSYEKLTFSKQGLSSAQMRPRIEAARSVQAARFGNSMQLNSEMNKRQIETYCRLDADGSSYMKEIYNSGMVSTRGYYKILKVARTAADIDGSEKITGEHIYEAAGFRSIDQKYWGR